MCQWLFSKVEKKHTFTQTLRGLLNMIGTVLEKGVGVTLSHRKLTLSYYQVLHILLATPHRLPANNCLSGTLWSRNTIKAFFSPVYSFKTSFPLTWCILLTHASGTGHKMCNILSSISPKNSLINKCLISQLRVINFTPCRYNNLQENYMLWEIYLLENVKADN